MKKKLVAVVAAGLAVCLSAFMLAGCGNSADNKASDSGDKKTLTVGFDAEYPPYGYVADDGSYTGFDLDLAQMVCDMEGWDFKADAIDWEAKDALLGSGSINCIWNGFSIEGREADYAFTDPYMKNGQVVVVKAGSDIKSLADLKGKIVLTQKGSAALDVLNDDKKDLTATFKELQTIGDYNNAFMQLESGAVDAVACDLSIAAYQLAAKPDAFTQLSEALSEENYGVGFAKDDTETAAKVTEDLKKLNEQGEIEKLCEKYSDQGISYSNWLLK